MKYLNKKETLLKLIECVKSSWIKFICNHAEVLCQDKIISKYMLKWVKSKMKPNVVPKQFHGDNFLNCEAVWTCEEEMRVKYLEYLIEQL